MTEMAYDFDIIFMKINKNHRKKGACLKKQHVYAAAWPRGRVAKINFCWCIPLSMTVAAWPKLISAVIFGYPEKWKETFFFISGNPETSRNCPKIEKQKVVSTISAYRVCLQNLSTILDNNFWGALFQKNSRLGPAKML